MADRLSSDPLRNFRFLVNITGGPNGGQLARMGFMGASGLSVNSEVTPYREGGMNTTAMKMPGQADFGPIGLTRGVLMGAHAEVWNWFRQIFAVGVGYTAPAGTDFRASSFTILVLQHPASANQTPSTPPPTKMRFTVYNAWCSTVAYSDLDAGGNGLMIESMQVQHEGFSVEFF